MIVADAIRRFRALHAGSNPAAVVVTPAAALILAAQEKIEPECDGIAVRIEFANKLPAVAVPGTGDMIIVHAVTDSLDRPVVVAVEAVSTQVGVEPTHEAACAFSLATLPASPSK